MCSPEDVAAILNVGEKPALRALLDGLFVFAGFEPHLVGAFPARPKFEGGEAPDPPTAPTMPPEPMIGDYAVPTSEESFLRRLMGAIFGGLGPSFEQSQRYQSALKAWEAEKRDWDSKMRRWGDEKRRHLEVIRAHQMASENFASALTAYDSRRATLLQSLENAKETYRRQRDEREAQIQDDVARLEKLLDAASENLDGGVAALTETIWNALPLPGGFPRRVEVEFEPDTGVLLLVIDAPDFERLPLTTPLKNGRKAVGDSRRRQTQQLVSHVLPLRVAHEIFATPELAAVKLVGVNVRLAYIDRRNGQSRHDVVASMMATREEFASISISNVDPKKCFRSLRGVETPSYDEMSAVRPLIEFDREDRRIVTGRKVVDGLDGSTNLASMDWEDFEHVVRELFAKMFVARSAGAEVHVTRASRDYGVDALVFDPDPIMGGKYVIQAKRYVNTVEVAAVRDLFGTVQNEGASKGFLVTTSRFGPDAHQFAKGKPLTLIDGPQLLGLLRQFGYEFRIDLAEARQVLRDAKDQKQPE